MDGYLLDTNHLIPLLRDRHPHREIVLQQLGTAAADSPVYVASSTLAELEVGCCLGATERFEAQAELREVVRANNLSVLDFTRHTAAEYGSLKASLMQKFNREHAKKNKAKWPELWTSPDKASTLGIDEFDLLVVSHAIERRLILVTTDFMRRILEGIAWPGDCPDPVNWIPVHDPDNRGIGTS